MDVRAGSSLISCVLLLGFNFHAVTALQQRAFDVEDGCHQKHWGGGRPIDCESFCTEPVRIRVGFLLAAGIGR